MRSTLDPGTDWVLDLGPNGGVRGGEIVAEGTPEQVAQVSGGYTGGYLKPMLERQTERACPRVDRAP